MKITVTTLKPRNRFVAPARFRQAGSHQPSDRAQRQRAARALRRELGHMKHSP
jgi:hypothetical protein